MKNFSHLVDWGFIESPADDGQQEFEAFIAPLPKMGADEFIRILSRKYEVRDYRAKKAGVYFVHPDRPWPKWDGCLRKGPYNPTVSIQMGGPSAHMCGGEES